MPTGRPGRAVRRLPLFQFVPAPASIVGAATSPARRVITGGALKLVAATLRLTARSGAGRDAPVITAGAAPVPPRVDRAVWKRALTAPARPGGAARSVRHRPVFLRPLSGGR